MILILACFILITGLCTWTGLYIHYVLTGGRSESTNNTGKHWIIYAFWGLITIALVTQIVVLFFPVNLFTCAAFVAAITLLSATHKRFYTHGKSWIRTWTPKIGTTALLSVLMIIPALVLSSGPTLMDDTESYHIQMVKWIQEYGSVPGIANLHERYGFNSSWFTLIGFFTPTQTTLNFFTVLNGTLSAWISIYLVSGIWLKLKTSALKEALALMLVFIIALACWPMIRGNATTSNYDFISACMVLVLFIELFTTGKADGPAHKFFPELLVWPVFLCTIRVTNFPLLLLSLYVILTQWKNASARKLFVPVLICFGLGLPFLARNVILSGYLLYPAYQVDLFQVDWKVKKEIAEELVRYIKYYNRVNNGFVPIEETAKLAFPGWIRAWFRYMFLYDKPVVILAIAGYIIGLSGWKRLRTFGPVFNWFLLTMIVQLLCWFFIAPDPRFAYGPLLIGIFLLPLSLRFNIGHAAGKFLSFLLILITITVATYAILKIAGDRHYRNGLAPASVPEPPLKVVHLDNIQLQIPERVNGNWNPRCYATPLPCLYIVDPGLKARGKTIRDGFCIEK